ncbi:MAG: hypothetical protein V3W18_00265 [candidate division Zixibacteria bacterium]
MRRLFIFIRLLLLLLVVVGMSMGAASVNSEETEPARDGATAETTFVEQTDSNELDEATKSAFDQNVAESNGQDKRIDSDRWVDMGSRIFNTVFALTVYRDELVAAQTPFWYEGSGPSIIARWNGKTWQALGSQMNGIVNDMTVYNDELIAAGFFTFAGGTRVNHIARWDGSRWQSIGSGTDGPVYAVTVYNGELIAGGKFSTAGNLPAKGLASWNGNAWRSLDKDSDYNITALTVCMGKLIAGETIVNDSLNINRIVCLEGNIWRPIDSFENRAIVDLAEYEDCLVAIREGTFFNEQDMAPERIALWRDQSWWPLGAKMEDDVFSLTVHKGQLIAGGWFTQLDKRRYHYLALWDGESWQPAGRFDKQSD